MEENKNSVENNNEVVNVSLQKIELPKMDYKKYIGKKSKISNIETLKGKHGYFLKLTSTVIDVVQFGKEDKEIKASRIFGLFVDKDGVIGWGDETQLGLFLKNKDVNHPEELLDREITLQVTNRDGNDYLTFI